MRPSRPAASRPVRYFHGGVPGLRPGDLLVPHPARAVDGCPICEARAAGATAALPGLGAVDPPTQRQDRVYVTTDREYARFYASLAGQGDLYVVEPLGGLEPSGEDLFPTWCVPEARVRAVYDRCVLLTWAQRRALARRWAHLEDAAAAREAAR